MLDFFQSFCKAIGDNACYFLDLIHIAEVYTGHSYDPFTCTVIASAHNSTFDTSVKCIDFNWNNLKDTNNFFCEDPDEILYLLTGKQWTHTRIDSSTYKAKKGDYIIRLWAKGSNKTGHFNCEDYDSYQDSDNVKNGKIIGYRVFRVKE